MGLYVAKDRDRTVISRVGLRVPDGRPVRRAWGALVEVRIPGHQVRVDPTGPMIAFIGLPPVVVVLAGLHYLGPLAAVLAGGLVLLLTSSIVPRFFRHRYGRSRLEPVGAGRSKVAPADGGQSRVEPVSGGRGSRVAPAAGATRELTAAAERAAFGRAVATADRVAETWPALGGLVDVPEAEMLLAEALWEIAGVLARRQELIAVLAQLTRPDFATLSPADGTAAKLRTQIRATKEALSAVEIDLAGREASLRRAEEAGRTFIREREMREAIRAAERSLAAAPPDPALDARPTPDPAADLAEHTHLVLAAYRELTATLHPEDTA